MFQSDMLEKPVATVLHCLQLRTPSNCTEVGFVFALESIASQNSREQRSEMSKVQ